MWFGGVDLSPELLFADDHTFVHQFTYWFHLRLVEIFVEIWNFLYTSFPADYRTGKSFSEVLISASTNPQYEDRLFIELQVQYIENPCSNLGRTCCVQNNFCTQHVLPMFC